LLYHHNVAGIALGTYLKKSTLPHVSLHLITVTMPRNPPPFRQIETRSGNKTAHPGNVVKAPKCRTTAEVEADRLDKARAKEDHKLSRKRSTSRVAQFECEDTTCEDGVYATPRPVLNSKPRPLAQPNRFPTECSDHDVETTDGDDFEAAPFVLDSADSSVTVDDPAAESNTLPPTKT
jgi:hypothetical protein